MLVLTRGLKQKIEIGNQLITVTVLEVGQVGRKQG